MEKIILQPEEEFEVKLKGKEIMLALNLLTELPYHTAKPIIESVEAQVKKQVEDRK